MNPLSLSNLAGYWADPALGASILVSLNLVGALVLGSLVGYERTFRSRAAGMRTLGLVCMAAAGITAICGYPSHWFGGFTTGITGDDPTRVIQGIVTGIGFLGAGVIMRDGMHISGLTTAAMIWVVSAIGILIGVGLYPAAFALAALSTAFTLWGSRFEVRLPSQTALLVIIQFDPLAPPDEDTIRQFLKGCGYIIARNTVSITGQEHSLEWRFIAIGRNKRKCASIPSLASQIGTLPGVRHFQLNYARN